jgi:hypothetical protein
MARVRITVGALIDVVITLAAICAGLGVGIAFMLWIVGRFMP